MSFKFWFKILKYIMRNPDCRSLEDSSHHFDYVNIHILRVCVQALERKVESFA